MSIKIPKIEQPDPLNRNHLDISCVARYVQLEPDLLVGYDGCGNVWERRISTDECWILSMDGTEMKKLPRCPASGDTLSTFPRSVR